MIGVPREEQKGQYHDFKGPVESAESMASGGCGSRLKARSASWYAISRRSKRSNLAIVGKILGKPKRCNSLLWLDALANMNGTGLLPSLNLLLFPPPPRDSRQPLLCRHELEA